MARLQMKFTVPEGVAKLAGVKSVTIREITAGDRTELLGKYVDKAAEFSTALVCSSIAAIDEKPVDRIEAQLFYDKAPSKLQDLLMAAYQSVNLPSEKERADFLDSAEAIIG